MVRWYGDANIGDGVGNARESIEPSSRLLFGCQDSKKTDLRATVGGSGPNSAG
jgi:hypothetical protein